MPGVLQGLTIVEMAGLGPAPFAAMMLADHGAEVIRVERAGMIGIPNDPLLRSRRSISLDLKQEAARGRLRVDTGFWGGVVPGNVGELDGLVEAGALGFKCFLVPSGVAEFEHVGRIAAKRQRAFIPSHEDDLAVFHRVQRHLGHLHALAGGLESHVELEAHRELLFAHERPFHARAMHVVIRHPPLILGANRGDAFLLRRHVRTADRLNAVGIDKQVRGWERPSDHVPVVIDLDG